ncbi:MAG: tellurite resistance TerB family protein [Janthinobacterium lividum]
MFDATKLLGSFLQTRQSGSSGSGIGGMVQQAISHFSGGTAGVGRPGGGLAGGLASGGLASGLSALLSQFTGSSQPASAQPAPAQSGSAQSGTAGGGMVEQIGDLARRAANAPMSELRGNNPAAVGGAGALAGALMGGGKGALGGGLLAVLGSLAYSAYQKQGAQPGAQPGVQQGTQLGTPASPAPDQALQAYADPAEVQRKASLVLRAMIQATKADGHLDDGERQRLDQHIAAAGDDAEAQSFLREQMDAPLDIAGLAAQVRSPQEGAEIYAASLMAITVDTQAERDYLAQLAAALHLPDSVVSHVHASLPRAV